MSTKAISSRFCSDLYELAKTRPAENVERIVAARPVTIIQNIHDADIVLRQRADNYPKNLQWLSQIAGHSRLTQDGAQWQFRQALSQPFIGKFDSERSFALTSAHAQHIVQALARQPQAQILDEAVIHHALLSVFTQLFLELEPSAIPMAADSASRLIQMASQYAFVAPGDEYLALSKEHLLEIMQLRKTVFAALQRLRADEIKRSAMLQKMLDAEAVEGFDFSFEKELITLFDAGTDSAAFTVGWAVHLLAQYPDLQERLHAQMQTIFARADNARQRQRAIERNTDLHAFIAEVLRLYPPLPFVTRTARGADRLSHGAIEAGSIVIVSLVGVNHIGLARDNPWTPDLDAAAREGKGMGTGLVSSFAWGKRICGGRQFALMELAATLSVLIHKLRFEVSRHEPVEYEWMGQMRRKGGHRVRAIVRSVQRAPGAAP
jgi:cytochrome P450